MASKHCKMLNKTFNNENDFKNSFGYMLRDKGFSCHKIESHHTEVGIPDTFIQGHCTDYWIEFKNKSLTFRPGQEAWYYTYRMSHFEKKCVLVAYHDGKNAYLIPKDGVDTPVLLTELHCKYIAIVLRWLGTEPPDTALLETFREYLICKVEHVCKHCFLPLNLVDWDPEIIMPGCDEPFDCVVWKQQSGIVLESLLSLLENFLLNRHKEQD